MTTLLDGSGPKGGTIGLETMCVAAGMCVAGEMGQAMVVERLDCDRIRRLRDCKARKLTLTQDLERR